MRFVMPLLAWFFPESAGASLSPTLRRRLPFLVGMDFLLLAYFALSATLRWRADPGVYGTFFAAVLATEAVFIISLGLIRARRYIAASYASSLGTLINVMWLGLLTPFGGPGDLYKFGIFLLAALVANSMVALEGRQVGIYFGAGLGGYALFVALVAWPASEGLGAELASSVITILLLYLAVSAVILFMTRHNRELVSLAEGEARASLRKARELELLLAESRAVLGRGESLRAASAASRERSAAIRRALDELREEARGLLANAAGADRSNAAVVERSRSVRQAVAEEGELLEQTGRALERIAKTVGGLAALAGERKQGVAALIATASRQGEDISGLRTGVERVRGSSDKVKAAASGIADLSEKTGLLAMNASIEAAHAGAMGKGFSVISQEVRKLAEETKRETAAISEALAMSAEAVRASSEAVERFARDGASLAADVRSTFDALGSILEGLAEVASESAELDRRAGALVGLVRSATEKVEGVSEGIESGAASLGGIRDFAGRLAESVELLRSSFGSIEEALAEAERVGAEHLEGIAALDRRLSEFGGAPEGSAEA